MKVKIELMVGVDPEAWDEAYGTGPSEADVADDVRRWAANAVSHHPDGLVELMVVKV